MRSIATGGSPRTWARAEGEEVPAAAAFEAEEPWAEETLQAFSRPWLVVGVGARWQTKRWPGRHFADLLARCPGQFGGTAIFVGIRRGLGCGPRGRCRTCAVPSLLLTGRTTLPQLGELLSQADVMLANDTGPLHLAAALGRPVVAPYTCTRVRLTGPYGHFHTAVETQVHCAGSLLKKCPRLECMGELTPERLWPLLEEVLSRWQQSHNSRSA